MICPYCSKEHPDEAKFCPISGQPLPALPLCAYYGQVHQSGARFCPVTGETLTLPPSKPVPEYTEPKRRRGFVWVLILTVLLTMCIIGLWVVVDNQILATMFSRKSQTAIPSEKLAETSALATSAKQTPDIAFSPPPISAEVTEIINSTPTPVATSTQAYGSPTSVTPWQACPGARLSQLSVGMQAYISYDPPEANRVRSDPNTNARILGWIYPGEKVEILDGPACANNWVWWKIRSLETGLTGWTSEGDQSAYWLLPLP